jgi:hypothetical protein
VKPNVLLFSTVAFFTTSLIAAEDWPEWRGRGRVPESVYLKRTSSSPIKHAFRRTGSVCPQRRTAWSGVLLLRTAAPTLLIDLGLLASE